MKPARNGVNLAIDFHGVLADLAQAQIILRRGGPPPFVEDITSWMQPVTWGWDYDADLRNPKLYEYMFPIRDAGNAMRGMHASGYSLEIVTDQPADAMQYTANWLAAWQIPYDKLTRTADKHHTGTDILVDDKAGNCQKYARTRGPALLFGQPWNRGFETGITAHPLVRRVGWAATLEQIRQWAFQERRFQYVS